MNGSAWWALTRASGLVAWASATAAVVWGAWLAIRASRRPSPAWVLDLHRFLGGLTVGFVALHLGALVADSYVHFDLMDLLVPFAARWRPGPVALGVVAVWLLLAVEGTSLAMRRLPRRWWRAVHVTSYGAWALATTHALTAGTDAGHPVVRAVTLLTVLLVSEALTLRVLSRRHPRPAGARAARPARAAAVSTTGGAGP